MMATMDDFFTVKDNELEFNFPHPDLTIEEIHFIFTNVKDIDNFHSCTNNIDDEKIKIIVQYLEKINIKTLILYDNDIRTNGAQEIARLIKKGLIELNLSHNPIKNDGIKYIADALVGSKLIKLNLSCNALYPDGIKYLMENINKSQLIYLDISQNIIDDSIIHALQTLTYLNISHSRTSDTIIKSITDVLPKSQLIELDISWNSITDIGGEYLANVIDKSKLIKLNFGFNKMSKNMEEKINDILKNKVRKIEL